ncbi:MAG: saccharopine dehydrogenase NADP-binding domain-containing protein [Thermoplasmatales archaeon]|nr:MAG: saccharopine dehydrogenase NADP-binding domain-containing protein [Thermoplasmatales archaeon]
MKFLVLGAGMMGRAIAYDLSKHLKFDNIEVADKEKKTIQSTKKFLEKKEINFHTLNIEKTNDVKKNFQNYDIAISAVPYKFNYNLAKIAIETKTHFLDLGGNNDIVKRERSLFENARKQDVIVIPDCGLAPGLTSVITKDIVEQMDYIDFVKIRVGGLPIHPRPPLNYQIVFSPYGLINEYVEDAIVLDHRRIIKKKPMADLEKIMFPKPFGEMEAFLTSGGCSTLPYTYKNKINYLDYKTIRYPGHCEKFKTILDLGLMEEREIKIGNQLVVPRDLLATILINNLPCNEKDVVLLKVTSEGMKDGKKICLEYTMIDYYDEEKDITSMMRTTGYSVSIIAQMIKRGVIKERGVFCPEEIIPCTSFFDELKKRDIIIETQHKYLK